MVTGTFEFIKNGFVQNSAAFADTEAPATVQASTKPTVNPKNIAKQLRLLVSPHLAGVHSSDGNFDPSLLATENNFENFYQNYFLPWLGTEDGLYFRNTFEDLFKDNSDNQVLAKLIFSGKIEKDSNLSNLQRRYEDLLVDFVEADPKAFARAHFKTKVGQELIKQALELLIERKVELSAEEIKARKIGFYSPHQRNNPVYEIRGSTASYDELANCVADVAYEEGFIKRETADAIDDFFTDLTVGRMRAKESKLRELGQKVEKILEQVNDRLCKLQAGDKKFLEADNKEKTILLGNTEYGVSITIETSDINYAKALVKEYADKADVRSQMLSHLAQAALEVANAAHWENQKVPGSQEDHNYVVELRRDCFRMLMGRINYIEDPEKTGETIDWQDFLKFNKSLQFYLRNKIAGPASLQESFVDIYDDAIAKHKSSAFQALVNFSDIWTVTVEFADRSTWLGFAFPFEGPIQADIKFSQESNFGEDEQKVIRQLNQALEQLQPSFIQGVAARVALSQKGDEFAEWANLHVHPALFDEETIKSDYKDIYHGILCIREIQEELKSATSPEDLEKIKDKLYKETSLDGRILTAKQAAEYDGVEVVWQSAQTAIAALAQVLILRGIGASGLLNHLKQLGPIEKALECYAKIPASARKVIETALAGGMQNANIMALDQALNAVFAIKMPGAFKDIGYMLMATFAAGAVFGVLFRPFLSLGLNKPLREWNKFDWIVALPAHISLDQAQEFAEELFEEKVGAWLQKLRHRFDPAALMNMFLSTVTGGFTQKTVTRALTNNPLSYLFPASETDDPEANNASPITGIVLTGILFSPLIYILGQDPTIASQEALGGTATQQSMIFMAGLWDSIKKLLGGKKDERDTAPATNPDAVESTPTELPTEVDSELTTDAPDITFTDPVPVPDPEVAAKPIIVDEAPILVADVTPEPDSLDIPVAPAPATTPAVADVLADAAATIEAAVEAAVEAVINPVEILEQTPVPLSPSARRALEAAKAKEWREAFAGHLDQLNDDARRQYESLTFEDQTTLAIIALKGNRLAVPANDLNALLNNNRVPGELAATLMLVEDLYNLGVSLDILRNFFRQRTDPLTRREVNYFGSKDKSRRRGVLRELESARWYLSQLPNAHIEFGNSYNIGAGRPKTEIDLTVSTRNANDKQVRFISESKSSVGAFNINDSLASELADQIARQAAVAKSQSDIAGMELVISARSISKENIARLIAMLDSHGVPWNLRLNLNSGALIIQGKDGQALNYDVRSVNLPKVTLEPRPLPNPPNTDDPGASGSGETASTRHIPRSVWDTDVQRVLRGIFEENLPEHTHLASAVGFDNFNTRSYRRVSREDATSLINPLLERANTALELNITEETEVTREARRTIKGARQHLETNRNSRPSKSTNRRIVQVAKAIAILEAAAGITSNTVIEAALNPAQISTIEGLTQNNLENLLDNLGLARQLFDDDVTTPYSELNLENQQQLEQDNDIIRYFEETVDTLLASNPDTEIEIASDEATTLRGLMAEETITARNLLEFIDSEAGQEFGWDSDFVNGLREYVENYDQLVAEIRDFSDELQGNLEARPVGEVFETLPEDVLKLVRDLAEKLAQEAREREQARRAAESAAAAVPETEATHPVTDPDTADAQSDADPATNSEAAVAAPVRPRPTPRPPEERARSILANMIGFQVDGEDSIFYPPRPIAEATTILETAGYTGEQIDTFINEAIDGNENTPQPIGELSPNEILPAGMVHARGRRRVPIFGTEVNINQMAARLVAAGKNDLARNLPLEGVSGGRHWINWQAVREAALTDPEVARIVFAGQLSIQRITELTINHNPETVALLRLLRVMNETDPNSIDSTVHGQNFYLVGVQGTGSHDNRFSQLQVLTEEEFNALQNDGGLPGRVFYIQFRVRNREQDTQPSLRVVRRGGVGLSLSIALQNLRARFNEAFPQRVPGIRNGDATQTTLGRHLIARFWRDSGADSTGTTRRVGPTHINPNLSAQVDTLNNPAVMGDLMRLTDFIDPNFNPQADQDIYLAVGVNDNNRENNLRFFSPRFYHVENAWIERDSTENIVFRYRYNQTTGELTLQEVQTQGRRNNDSAIQDLRRIIHVRQEAARPDGITPGVRRRRPSENNNGN